MTVFALSRTAALLPRSRWRAEGISNGHTVGEHGIRAAILGALVEAMSAVEPLGPTCLAAVTSNASAAVLGDWYQVHTRGLELSSVRARLEASIPPLWRSAGPNSSVAQECLEFDTLLQSRELAAAGYQDASAVSPKPGAITNTLLVQMAAEVDTSVFPSRPDARYQRPISVYYAGPEYFLHMMEFSRRQSDPRLTILDNLVAAGVVRNVSASVNIADIGCGTANLGLHLARRAQKAILNRVDVNRHALDGLPAGTYGSVEVRNRLLDFTQRWPMERHSQNFVILGEVLEHAFDPAWLLAEARRVLRPSGQIILTVPNHWHWRKILRFLFRQRLEKSILSDHIRYFSPQTLSELLDSAGFLPDETVRFSVRRRFTADWIGGLERMYRRLPWCARNLFVVATDGSQGRLTPAETLEDEAALMMAFVLKVTRAQSFPFSGSREETIAQASYRIGLMALSVAPELQLDPAKIVLAMVFRSIVEATVADMSSEARAALIEKHADLFASAVRELPAVAANRLQQEFAGLAATREWMFLGNLYAFELLGRSRAGLATFERTQEMASVERMYPSHALAR